MGRHERRDDMQRIRLPMRVWDAPTRLFHWCLVLLVAWQYVSMDRGWIHLHMLGGYCVLALLAFRLIWGFAGSDTARFARFLRSPLAALDHLRHMLRREDDHEVGHNAAGGWMVVVLLLVLAAQVATGLCANTYDDFLVNGPLASYVGKAWSNWASGMHGRIFNVLLALVAAHVLAVLAYAVLKGQDLVRPMVTGKKRLPGATPAPRMASPLRALAVIVVAAAIAAGVANLP
jgi:cytochrome b